MVETSSNLEPDVMETVIRVGKRKDFGIYAEAALGLRERWVANFSRGVLKSRHPVDQREVDEKRGFWDGVHWALVRFPKMTEKELAKLLNEPLEESE